MARITVSVLNKGFARRQISIIRDLSERQVYEIAKSTEAVIQAKIRERIKRDGSTGNLANSFTTVKISGGWGVGDINFLNQQAPYWYWQNYGIAQSGRRIPPASKGSFQPGNTKPSSGGAGQRWQQGGQGFYTIKPTKAIEAKNYIQATVNEINQIVASVVRRIKI